MFFIISFLLGWGIMLLSSKRSSFSSSEESVVFRAFALKSHFPFQILEFNEGSAKTKSNKHKTLNSDNKSDEDNSEISMSSNIDLNEEEEMLEIEVESNIHPTIKDHERVDLNFPDSISLSLLSSKILFQTSNDAGQTILKRCLRFADSDLSSLLTSLQLRILIDVTSPFTSYRENRIQNILMKCHTYLSLYWKTLLHENKNEIIIALTNLADCIRVSDDILKQNSDIFISYDDSQMVNCYDEFKKRISMNEPSPYEQEIKDFKFDHQNLVLRLLFSSFLILLISIVVITIYFSFRASKNIKSRNEEFSFFNSSNLFSFYSFALLTDKLSFLNFSSRWDRDLYNNTLIYLTSLVQNVSSSDPYFDYYSNITFVNESDITSFDDIPPLIKNFTDCLINITSKFLSHFEEFNRRNKIFYNVLNRIEIWYDISLGIFLILCIIGIILVYIWLNSVFKKMVKLFNSKIPKGNIALLFRNNHEFSLSLPHVKNYTLLSSFLITLIITLIIVSISVPLVIFGFKKQCQDSSDSILDLLDYTSVGTFYVLSFYSLAISVLSTSTNPYSEYNGYKTVIYNCLYYLSKVNGDPDLLLSYFVNYSYDFDIYNIFENTSLYPLDDKYFQFDDQDDLRAPLENTSFLTALLIEYLRGRQFKAAGQWETLINIIIDYFYYSPMMNHKVFNILYGKVAIIILLAILVLIVGIIAFMAVIIIISRIKSTLQISLQITILSNSETFIRDGRIKLTNLFKSKAKHNFSNKISTNPIEKKLRNLTKAQQISLGHYGSTLVKKELDALPCGIIKGDPIVYANAAASELLWTETPIGQSLSSFGLFDGSKSLDVKFVNGLYIISDQKEKLHYESIRTSLQSEIREFSTRVLPVSFWGAIRNESDNSAFILDQAYLVLIRMPSEQLKNSSEFNTTTSGLESFPKLNFSESNQTKKDQFACSSYTSLNLPVQFNSSEFGEEIRSFASQSSTFLFCSIDGTSETALVIFANHDSNERQRGPLFDSWSLASNLKAKGAAIAITSASPLICYSSKSSEKYFKVHGQSIQKADMLLEKADDGQIIYETEIFKPLGKDNPDCSGSVKFNDQEIKYSLNMY